jgi:hypothetical protein
MEVAQALSREAVKHARATNDMRARTEAQMAYLALKSSAHDGSGGGGALMFASSSSLSSSSSSNANSAMNSSLGAPSTSIGGAAIGLGSILSPPSTPLAASQSLALTSAPSLYKQRILFKQTQQRIRQKQVHQWQKIGTKMG